MGYPNYPNNRLIVNGVDLSEKFKMVLADGYTLEPPEPKIYTVDIPGGNGAIDLTESLFGDTAYKNRKHEFTFYVINPDDFESVKSKISSFLHGKDFYYKMTMDPNYTYRGRFKVTSYTHAKYSIGKVGCIKIAVDVDPFKYGEAKIFNISAIGGVIVTLPSGRMRVRPTIETKGFTKVIYNKQLINIQEGTWVLNDVFLTEGDNEIYFNSHDIKSINWSNLLGDQVTWGSFKKKALYEWYSSKGYSILDAYEWSDISEKTWTDLSEERWVDQAESSEIEPEANNIIVKYEWGDL